MDDRPRRMAMDAIAQLESDHRKFEKMLGRLDETTERAVKTREDLFSTLRDELTVHETIEEEVFYPALKEHPRARDIVLEGYEEHHVVDDTVSELAEVPYGDEVWTAKFSVMKENLEHHIEEEERDMFKKARQVFDEEELAALGAAMADRRMAAQRDPASAS
jgi:iron-sulfur cluster repair protein YtfE (RIC family)